MLRFDLPAVSANVIRWEAVITFIVCNLALFVSPWFMAILVVQALVKDFFRILSIFPPKMGWFRLIWVIISRFVLFGFTYHFAIDAIFARFCGDVDVAAIRPRRIFG